MMKRLDDVMAQVQQMAGQARGAGPGRVGADGRPLRAELRRPGHPLVPQHPPHLPELLQELRLHLHRRRRLEELQGGRGGQEPGDATSTTSSRSTSGCRTRSASTPSPSIPSRSTRSRPSRQRCEEIQRKYNKAVFFVGKLVFEEENVFTRFLHNQTAFSIQRILQFKGIPSHRPARSGSSRP